MLDFAGVHYKLATNSVVHAAVVLDFYFQSNVYGLVPYSLLSCVYCFTLYLFFFTSGLGASH